MKAVTAAPAQGRSVKTFARSARKRVAYGGSAANKDNKCNTKVYSDSSY